jgi:hypothetical protein
MKKRLRTFMENIGLIKGRPSVSRVNFYPNVAYWRQVARIGYDHIYNRYAHIVFTANPEQTEPFALGAADFVSVRVACSNFIIKGVDYAVWVKPLKLFCARHLETIAYPNMPFYLYKISNAAL